MIEYTVEKGESIGAAVNRSVSLAKQNNQIVKLQFNGIKLEVHTDSASRDILRLYDALSLIERIRKEHK